MSTNEICNKVNNDSQEASKTEEESLAKQKNLIVFGYTLRSNKKIFVLSVNFQLFVLSVKRKFHGKEVSQYNTLKKISEDEDDHSIMSMKRGMLKSIQD